ncbi:MAG TPA: hypothetical protein VFV75_16980 [Candidatus Polarisedimenticolaceae bacterium]|nr:hypothetical protein [Candidatus Polarisedimenticolaceae bacterium]
MHTTHARRMRLLAPLALALVAGLGAFSLRAGDALSTEFADTTDPSAPSNPPLNVREANVDGNGNIKVHEQGVVQVTGTVDVGNSPKVQDVNVINDALEVKLPDQGTSLIYEEVIDDFNEGFLRTVDIHEYARVRFATVVNGTGTVEFFLSTDGGVKSNFEVEAAGNYTFYLGEAAGTRLTIQCVDPDGEQIFLRVFGSN